MMAQAQAGVASQNHIMALPFPRPFHNVAARQFMNAKLLLKTVFLIAILLLLVIMGMGNRQTVELRMPPLVSQVQRFPAALMYFGFFAIGFLSGTVLTAGSKGSKGAAKSKAEK